MGQKQRVIFPNFNKSVLTRSWIWQNPNLGSLRPTTPAVPTPVSPARACRCYNSAALIQVGLLPHLAILPIQSNRSQFVLILKPSPLCSRLLTGPNQENRSCHLQVDKPPHVCMHLPLPSSSPSRGLPSSYLKPNPTGDLDAPPAPTLLTSQSNCHSLGCYHISGMTSLSFASASLPPLNTCVCSREQEALVL